MMIGMKEKPEQNLEMNKDNLYESWKSVESIASEAESCKQCGRLGWSSDPKNCDDCSDPAGDGYEPDLDDTSWNGELGTGLY